MSSFGRQFIPIGLAVVFGIVNGYYAFNPALKEQQKEMQQSIAKDDKTAEVRDASQQGSSKADTSPTR
ncbi:hypothetical protein F4677DRAFT_402661 [Hypoxylon crocopeplum]|nr:hypothetical protein F4677DRAFT_402661 [Hypoxylon crocopeplum]